ncbi:MAG: hypothetical protein E7045_06180 [Lentisphaerae bacterium]|nr:hypothetical protein [Lentisphaerota bacterium]
MKKNSGRFIPVVLVILAGIAFIYAMNHWFETSSTLRALFSGGDSGAVLGEVGENSEASLAMRGRVAAKVSMMIFAVITVLQFVAFAVGAVVVGGIRKHEAKAEQKLQMLDNAEIFFDVPLYVGLFGTVSAFLVMTFSPQSSRLIAYSSTLIGIIFSLVLRLIMQYPLRRRLINEAAEEKK